MNNPSPAHDAPGSDGGALAAPAALEQLGALASLLVHDLANHLCIISGNATLAQMMFHDTARLESSVHSIVTASGQAGELLERIGSLRRGMLDAMVPQPLAALLPMLSALPAAAPGWTARLPDTLPGESVVPANWVAFALRQIIAESKAPGGGLVAAVIPYAEGPPDLQRRPNLPPHARLLRLELSYASSAEFPFAEIRAKHTNLQLLAAVEFIRSVGGKLEWHSGDAGAQRVLLFVPLLRAA